MSINITYILSHNKTTYFENLGTTKNQRPVTTTHKDVIDRERDPPPKLYKSSCHIGHWGGNDNFYLQGNIKQMELIPLKCVRSNNNLNMICYRDRYE